jgi:hypothetical protein
MLTACKLLADALPPGVRKAACAAAIARHAAVWFAGGCNPFTLGFHVAAITYVYGGE